METHKINDYTLTISKDVNAAYFYVKDVEFRDELFTVEIFGGVNVDYALNGELVGIELLSLTNGGYPIGDLCGEGTELAEALTQANLLLV